MYMKKKKVTKKMLKQVLLERIYNVITGPTKLTTEDIEALKILLKKDQIVSVANLILLFLLFRM